MRLNERARASRAATPGVGADASRAGSAVAVIGTDSGPVVVEAPSGRSAMWSGMRCSRSVGDGLVDGQETLADEALLTELATRHLGPDCAVAHHDHAVADRDELLVVGGRDQHPRPGLGRPVDE